MSKRSFDKKPLYRKVNTRTHGVRHGNSVDYRHQRNTKREAKNPDTAMHSKHHHGRDYTPLFRFLLSKVGQSWDPVFSEAVGRLDSEEPIWYMVARNESNRVPIFWAGESSSFSGLFIDDDGILQLVAPDLTNEKLWPSCSCCTHTFNGRRLSNAFDPGRTYASFSSGPDVGLENQQ